MRNPARALAKQFVRRSPMTLLVFGVTLSFADFLVLYAAARDEGVLYINQGVGLLSNYGLFSTLLGNAVFLYVSKKYYDFICSMRASKAVIDTAPVEESLVALTDKIEMQREYQFGVYLLIVIGALFWLNNFSAHVSGDPVVTWGHKVFDSTDHRLSFIASTRRRSLIVIPGVTTKKPRVYFLLPGRRTAFTVCQAISIAITVVFPAPVASFKASRLINGFASLFALARWSRNFFPVFPNVGATSLSQMAVSAASI